MKKSIIRKIDLNRKYRVREIIANGFILNREGKRDRFLVYRLIRNKQLPGRMSVFGRLEVLGRDLKEFVEEYYVE